MVETKILINTINNVKKLVAAANKQTFDIDLIAGRYVIDAKSIMGVFSLDLSKHIDLRIHADEEETVEFLKEISNMIR